MPFHSGSSHSDLFPHGALKQELNNPGRCQPRLAGSDHHGWIDAAWNFDFGHLLEEVSSRSIIGSGDRPDRPQFRPGPVFWPVCGFL